MSSYPHNQDGQTPPLPEITGYHLHRVINHGGMSTVYLADQLALGREVAVKVMAPQALADEVSRRRFENEVRTVARLEHPHVVRIYELGRTKGGLPYFTMPHLARGHLGQRDFSHDESRVVEISQALFDALAYAHTRGIVHRDVKPENVLFDDAERPLLADFGIALRRGFGPRVTAAGMAVGSTAYMAPEQARGEEVDGRADLYSLGVLIWEMLAGSLPFQAGDALSMAVMHAQNPIPKLPLPLRHWQRFMNRALAKQPAQRFQDVAQMREAMSGVRTRRQWAWLSQLRARRDAVQGGIKPRIAALAVASMVVLGIVLAFSGSRDRSFFKVAKQAPATAVDVGPDPTEAMLEPLPEAPLQVALDNARRQIAQRQLTAPEGGNAFESVLAAWRVDPANPAVAPLVDELTVALTGELVRNLKDGNNDRARDYYQRATMLGEQTGNANTAAFKGLQEKTAAAFEARISQAAKRYDRVEAERIAKQAAEFELPASATTKLVAQAKAIPKFGETMPGDRGRGVLREGAQGAFVIGRRPVSRGEYARFATASGRPAILCRERGSVLRVLAPRSWQNPGFEQIDSGPVVCVSIADAESYARWHSQQTGHRYRLPTAAEARQTAAEIDGQDVSLWLRDCASNCLQRQAAGSSWRSKQAQRPLSSGRGYDDVGFRLVREM